MSAMIEPTTITHLDKDWAVPCELIPTGQGKCEEVAAWIAWSVRCCSERSASTLMCAPCQSQLVVSRRWGFCAHCKTIFAPGITGFSSIEPLNRGFQ